MLGAMAIVLMAGVGWAEEAWESGSMDGKPHDLRARLGIDRVCVVCHVAHNAPNADAGPIWNHAVTTQTFYRNAEVITLNNHSKLCMSCHDGVTAVDSYGGNIGTDVLTVGSGALGNDFTNDHPIGIVYADATAHGLEPEANVESYLEDGRIECGSCHRAHSASIRRPVEGSQICRVCHGQ
jgi:hypothetical protein